MRWLKAGWPVVNFAKERQLPLDIVVQPQAKPGDAPLAMGFEHDRCKLVLSMRGNPEAESTLAQIPSGLLEPVVQAMVAHELGHCWRYVHGAWHTVPAGFVDRIDETAPIADREIARLRHEMRPDRVLHAGAQASNHQGNDEHRKARTGPGHQITETGQCGAEPEDQLPAKPFGEDAGRHLKSGQRADIESAHQPDLGIAKAELGLP